MGDFLSYHQLHCLGCRPPGRLLRPLSSGICLLGAPRLASGVASLPPVGAAPLHRPSGSAPSAAPVLTWHPSVWLPRSGAWVFGRAVASCKGRSLLCAPTPAAAATPHASQTT